MRILIVGGGPAGLFFALMAQRCVPGAEIQVREQNPGGVTYGWGFGFTQSALDALRPAAPDVIGQLEGNCPHEVMEMVLNGEAVQVAGDPMHSNARWALLDVLESAARAEGVRIEHDVVTTLEESDLDQWDLVIGADGVNSRTREAFADAFEPSVFLTDNWLAWYGTSRKFHPSIILQDTDHGVVMAHASQFSDDLSNFTVEVGQEAFESLGFAGLTEEESVALCQELFAAHLDGEPLLANHSAWFQAKFVSCERWSHRNLVLIGDALHTVHPSIGSGTRFAMRDAVYLIEALVGADWQVGEGLRAFEGRRKPIADAFQAAARRSIAWYEAVPTRQIDDPVKFALEYIMRTGRVRYPDFRRANKAVIDIYETELR